MKRRKLFVLTLLFFVFYHFCNAQDEGASLPDPDLSATKNLTELLNLRKTVRTFQYKPFTQQQLSNLLWSAFGVNRPATLYEPLTHRLISKIRKDLRGITGKQDFVSEVPVNLVYVANCKKMNGITDKMKAFYSAADCGFIGQNVYLYCASSGLGTVFRGAIHKALELKQDQKVVYCQSVDWPLRND